MFPAAVTTSFQNGDQLSNSAAEIYSANYETNAVQLEVRSPNSYGKEIWIICAQDGNQSIQMLFEIQIQSFFRFMGFRRLEGLHFPCEII